MKLGYNTNGLACHRWRDALELLAETGYQSVAVTIDHHWMDPGSSSHRAEVAAVGRVLEQLGLECVIETGARYLLDPREKHEPTLLSAAPERRIAFLNQCIDIAVELNAAAVSCWSGVLKGSVPRDAALDRLVEGCRRVLDHAARRDVRLAFEPEPGMLIESMDDFAELQARLDDAAHFGLTLDIGHVQCVEPCSIPEVIRTWRQKLWNVHIEDMCRGVHEHLRFGDGEIEFVPVMAALQDVGYTGGVHVELSRHSHMAPQVVRESYEFLDSIRRTFDGE